MIAQTTSYTPRAQTSDLEAKTLETPVAQSKRITPEEFSQLFSQVDALAAIQNKDYTDMPKTQDLSVDGFRTFAIEMGYEPSLVERVLAINHPTSKEKRDALALLDSQPSIQAVKEAYISTIMEALAAAYPSETFMHSSTASSTIAIQHVTKKPVAHEERYGFLGRKKRTITRHEENKQCIMMIEVDTKSTPRTIEVELYNERALAIKETIAQLDNAFGRDYTVKKTHYFSHPVHTTA